MPRRDGTGPMGQGTMTGRGLGVCSGVNAPGCGPGFGRGLGRGKGLGTGFGHGAGQGYGCRRGFAFGGYNPGQAYGLTDREILIEQKEFLAKRLDAVNKQLENLGEGDK